VANQGGGLLGGGPFAPLVTLAFLGAQGNNKGHVQLLFNVPAIKHEANVPLGYNLWIQSVKSVATATDNNNAQPTSGSRKAEIGGTIVLQ
jgi:hypothetical protein